MTRAVTVLLAAHVLVVTACSSADRVAVRFVDVEVSDDRRTLTVSSYYAGFCRRIADGVDVDVRDDEIVVSVWLREETDEDGSCDAECGMVTQVAQLDVPLPELPIVQRAGARLGCGEPGDSARGAATARKLASTA